MEDSEAEDRGPGEQSRAEMLENAETHIIKKALNAYRELELQSRQETSKKTCK